MLKLPSVSSTTALTPDRSAWPCARAVWTTSSGVTRSRRIAVSREPSRYTNAGSDFTARQR